MTRKQAAEMNEFEGAVCNAIPDGTPWERRERIIPTIRELMRLSRRHGRLQERLCSEPDDDGRLGRMDERLEERIKALVSADPLACAIKGVILGGDPRGYTVKVLLRNGKYNTWGGAEDGWGVPQ